MRRIPGPPAEPITVAGFTAAGFEPVREAFAAGQANDPGGAQLCIYQNGQVVVDLWSGRDVVNDRPIDGDSLIMVASATKGVQAISAALLIDRKELDPEQRVSYYWPEFAKHGKDDTQVWHLLTHSDGVPAWPADSGLTAWDYPDWDRCVAALADAQPLWSPGTARAYHVVCVGHLVGEVMRRITGQTPGEFLTSEVAGPIDAEFFIGLPEELDDRYIPQITNDTAWGTLPWQTDPDREPDEVDELLAVIDADPTIPDLMDLDHSREGRGAEVPGATGIGTARGLARLYAACIGEVDGRRLISDSTRAFVSTSRTDVIPSVGGDRGRALPPYGLGFRLEGGAEPAMLGPASFGHPGGGGREAFADPGSGIAVGYTCSNLVGIESHRPRTAWLTALREIVLS